MIILADVMINWKVVPPPKFKKEYPGKLLRVLKMPPKGQYLGGDYYVGSKIEDKIPDGSVFRFVDE